MEALTDVIIVCYVSVIRTKYITFILRGFLWKILEKPAKIMGSVTI